MKCHVGDLAIITKSEKYPEIVGQQCEITSTTKSTLHAGEVEIYTPGYVIGDGTKISEIPSGWIRLIPYDGNQASTWEAVADIWRPKELVM